MKASIEMCILVELLAKNEIPYEINYIYGTMQVVYPSKEECIIDAVSHKFSYGHEQGLLEIMFRESEEVYGNLTGKEVYEIICKDYLERIDLYGMGI